MEQEEWVPDVPCWVVGVKFPALSILSVWGSNPRPLINVAAVVVGSILLFLWSHDGSDSVSLRNDAGSLSGAVKVY